MQDQGVSMVEFVESLLPGCRLPTSYCILSWWRAERGRNSLILFIRALIPFTRASPSLSYLILITVPKHHLILSHWGVIFQYMNLGGQKHSVLCSSS